MSRKDGIEKFDSPVRGSRNKEKTANVSMSGGGGGLGSSYTVNPLSPNIHIQFLQTDLYILLKNVLREYDKRSRYLLIVDHFTNSHNLIS